MNDYDQDWWMEEAMIRQGGSFVHWLGHAARAADPNNLARIKSTWPGYWADYGVVGLRLRRKEDPSFGKGQPGAAGSEAETEPGPPQEARNER